MCDISYIHLLIQISVLFSFNVSRCHKTNRQFWFMSTIFQRCFLNCLARQQNIRTFCELSRMQKFCYKFVQARRKNCCKHSWLATKENSVSSNLYKSEVDNREFERTVHFGFVVFVVCVNLILSIIPSSWRAGRNLRRTLVLLGTSHWVLYLYLLSKRPFLRHSIVTQDKAK